MCHRLGAKIGGKSGVFGAKARDRHGDGDKSRSGGLPCRWSTVVARAEPGGEEE
jgi:hypothetical protein